MLARIDCPVNKKIVKTSPFPTKQFFRAAEARQSSNPPQAKGGPVVSKSGSSKWEASQSLWQDVGFSSRDQRGSDSESGSRFVGRIPSKSETAPARHIVQA